MIHLSLCEKSGTKWMLPEGLLFVHLYGTGLGESYGFIRRQETLLFSGIW